MKLCFYLLNIIINDALFPLKCIGVFEIPSTVIICFQNFARVVNKSMLIEWCVIIYVLNQGNYYQTHQCMSYQLTDDARVF